MFVRILSVTLTLLMLFISASFAGQSVISVPEGTPPVIDGTMSPGEWNSARVDTFADGSELLLMFSEGYLYLGIRAVEEGTIVGNVFIRRGDEIAILHASAALGTAIYNKGTDSWERSQDFVWRCRSTTNDETAQAERDAFLKEDNWVSVNARVGTPNELEFRIEVTEESLCAAVNFIRFRDQGTKIIWPVDLDDDCVTPTTGLMSAQLHFSPEKWGTINIPWAPEHQNLPRRQ